LLCHPSKVTHGNAGSSYLEIKSKATWQRYNLIKMKRRIKHNDLTAWFLEDHATLPASYVKSCQEFFDEISKRQASSDKPQASSDKLPHVQTTE
jgi:hypothetical protein